MGHKFDVKNKKKLDSEERRKILPPHQVLSGLGIKKGDILADIGCGIGYFAIPASQIVGPEGKVYALDISSEMLEEVTKRAEEQNISNISTVKTEENNFNLKDKTVNFAFIGNVLHEVEDKKQFLGEVHRILTPNGKVAILDWQKIESEFGPPIDHRLDKKEVEKTLKEAGFNKVLVKDFSELFYIVMGEKE